MSGLLSSLDCSANRGSSGRGGGPFSVQRSGTLTIELDFEGHGIGRLLVPLVGRRQAKDELPRNGQNLKELLEAAA